MISVEPSKIRLIRRSRRICSAGMPFSPRARSDSAVSYPRPPRIWISSSAICHAFSEANSLISPASIRMSLRSSSASRQHRSISDSRPYVVAAMKAIFWATASCRATGRPHWTRAAAHCRATPSAHFPAPTQLAASESRPVFSVVSAIFRPWPSRPMTFSVGTNTWWNRVTLFSSPRSPRKALRRSTVIPGESPSTTNAVIPPRCPSDAGTCAMTTSSVANVPLVAHSLTPSSQYPPCTGVAVHDIRAGSEPTSGSVSRNADTSPAASRGRYRCFCSAVPKSLSGCGTPMDWCADSSAPMAGFAEPTRVSARQ